MVIPSGQQGSTSRRTERRGVELGIAEAGFCQSVSGWHVDATAKPARDAEAHIVDEDDHNIRRPLRRVQGRLLRGRGISRVERYRASIRLIGDRENLASYPDILCHARGSF